MFKIIRMVINSLTMKMKNLKKKLKIHVNKI